MYIMWHTNLDNFNITLVFSRNLNRKYSIRHTIHYYIFSSGKKLSILIEEWVHWRIRELHITKTLVVNGLLTNKFLNK